MERVWNGHPAQHHFSGIAFDGLERNSGLDPELWIGVWIGMCAHPCSGPVILSGSHIAKTMTLHEGEWVKYTHNPYKPNDSISYTPS